MDLSARKDELLQKLELLNDPILIQKLESVLLSHLLQNDDWWNTISDADKEAILQGIDELDRGQTIPHEEVMRILNARIQGSK